MWVTCKFIMDMFSTCACTLNPACLHPLTRAHTHTHTHAHTHTYTHKHTHTHTEECACIQQGMHQTHSQHNTMHAILAARAHTRTHTNTHTSALWQAMNGWAYRGYPLTVTSTYHGECACPSVEMIFCWLSGGKEMQKTAVPGRSSRK